MKKGARAKAGVATMVFCSTSMATAACAVTTVVPTPGPSDNATTGITVTASDSGCQVSATQAPAGPVTFVITNDGTKATAFYVLGVGDRVVGAAENIAPGLQRKLEVPLGKPGAYRTSCKPGMIGDGLRGPFTVTGDDFPMTVDDRLADAAVSYQDYLRAQTGALVSATAAFVGAVKKGDVVGAEAIYPTARSYYQRTRPAAASFDDELAARIRMHQTDIGADQQWFGFHRLESDLWATGLQPDTNAVADQLLADVERLDEEVKAPTWTVDPRRIAGGAVELLDFVAANASSGADEEFSHTDLWSFQASVDGAQAAVASVRPVLDQLGSDLGSEVDAQFAAVDQLLSTHRDGGGFVFYDKVAGPERQRIVQAVQALAAVVGRVQAAIEA